ncbi:hypothetical protein ACFL2D_03180 [Patescibacteria group bacterium]
MSERKVTIRIVGEMENEDADERSEMFKALCDMNHKPFEISCTPDEENSDDDSCFDIKATYIFEASTEMEAQAEVNRIVNNSMIKCLDGARIVRLEQSVVTLAGETSDSL